MQASCFASGPRPWPPSSWECLAARLTLPPTPDPRPQARTPTGFAYRWFTVCTIRSKGLSVRHREAPVPHEGVDRLLVVNLLGTATGPYVTGLIGDRASLTQLRQRP